MSVIAVGSTSRASNNTRTVTKSLEIALSEFGSALTDGERKQLQQIKGVPDASAALTFTFKLDASNSTRRGKSVGTRAYSMLQSIQQFSAIVDTFISANPNIAALVWGSVKLTLLVSYPSRREKVNSVEVKPNNASRLRPISPRTSNPLLIYSWVSISSSPNSMNINFFFRTRPLSRSQYAYSMPLLFNFASSLFC
jgi:hypothetical protein